MSEATARAHANIALVKYWGKRDAELNLPAAGSLSLTLDALTTTTTVCFDAGLERDTLELDGEPADATRLSAWLDLVRARSGIDDRAAVVSANDFPTASGLASSASAYAALALAASRAAGLSLTDRELSELARRGSGSAARSIFGGVVLMHAGSADDGSDAIAEPIDDVADWPLRMVVAVVGGGAPKKRSSRDAMKHCAETSPLYAGWIASVDGDIAAARAAVSARAIDALGAVVEHSALAMHAAAIASRPPIIYWRPETLAVIEAARLLRDDGVPAWPTMDAGPHVKLLTLAEHVDAVQSAAAAVAGVTETIVSGPGGPARIIEP
jgi:diphosphomevalonate decarboxylase